DEREAVALLKGIRPKAVDVERGAGLGAEVDEWCRARERAGGMRRQERIPIPLINPERRARKLPGAEGFPDEVLRIEQREVGRQQLALRLRIEHRNQFVG